MLTWREHFDVMLLASGCRVECETASRVESRLLSDFMATEATENEGTMKATELNTFNELPTATRKLSAKSGTRFLGNPSLSQE